MCLCVYTAKHLINNSLVPKIADTDILVYKLLSLSSNGNIYTPYQGYRIDFKEGTFVYPQTKIGKLNGISFFVPYIDEGIHSCFSKNAITRIFNVRLYSNYDNIYYAIIPKGSEYYIGMDGDIVSNNLIVFENKEIYNKYESTHKVTIIE